MLKEKPSKKQIKEFFEFKTLITETVLKYVFIGLLGLATLGGIVIILSAWVTAFRYGNPLAAIISFFITPIIVVIGLFIYGLLLRIGFESVLVRFSIYREIRQMSKKTED